MTLRRYLPMKQSAGTGWPTDVRRHVDQHQPWCIGPLAGMPLPCGGSSELDHIRASGAVSMKSKSIAVNGARLCGLHHRMKTNAGKTWRPPLLEVVGMLHGDCEACQAESLKHYGVPLDTDRHAAHVDPCGLDCRASVPPR